MHSPLVEVEVAFIMRSALEGPGVTAEEVLAATEKIAIALEVVDSRWSGQPGLGQIVADNSNAAAIVLGPRISNTDLNLSTVWVDVQVGEYSLSGNGTSVMGNPLHAVSWLIEQLSRQNKRIEAGQIILSGSMTTPTPVQPGDLVRVDMRGMGTMTVTFGDQ
jgi:2-keto-4-pentenoate hydratase